MSGDCDSLPVSILVPTLTMKTKRFDLISNLFQMRIDLLSPLQFTFLSATVAVTLLSLSFGFWFSLKTFSRSRHPPPFRYLALLKITLRGLFKGVGLSLFLLLIPLLIIYCLIGGNSDETVLLGSFNSISGDFIHNSLTNTQARNGRYGLVFAIYGALGILECFRQISYKPHQLSFKVFGSSESCTLYNMKCLVMVIIYSLVVNFFSFSPEFNSSRQLMYVAIISTIGELLKLKLYYSSNDYLITLPFALTIELMNLLMSRFSSNNFVQLFVNLLWLVALRYISRLYFAPGWEKFSDSFDQWIPWILENITSPHSFVAYLTWLVWNLITLNTLTKHTSIRLIQKIFHFHKVRYRVLKKVILESPNGITSTTIESATKALREIHHPKLTRKEKADLELHHRRKEEDKELEEQGIEGLIKLFISVSIDQVSNIMIFIFTLFVWSFSDQLLVEEFSTGFQPNNAALYTIFSLTCMLVLILCDPFILNSFELRFGYKMFDYCAYQQCRASVRIFPWILNNPILDASINPVYCRIDHLCFSSQYYFLITMTALHILLVIVGIQICILNQYSPFVDYCSIMIFIFSIFLFLFGKQIVLYFWKRYQILLLTKENRESYHKNWKQWKREEMRSLNPPSEDIEREEFIIPPTSPDHILKCLLFWSSHHKLLKFQKQDERSTIPCQDEGRNWASLETRGPPENPTGNPPRGPPGNLPRGPPENPPRGPPPPRGPSGNSPRGPPGNPPRGPSENPPRVPPGTPPRGPPRGPLKLEQRGSFQEMQLISPRTLSKVAPEVPDSYSVQPQSEEILVKSRWMDACDAVTQLYRADSDTNISDEVEKYSYESIRLLIKQETRKLLPPIQHQLPQQSIENEDPTGTNDIDEEDLEDDVLYSIDDIVELFFSLFITVVACVIFIQPFFILILSILVCGSFISETGRRYLMEFTLVALITVGGFTAMIGIYLLAH